jgi:hypothetical protein
MEPLKACSQVEVGGFHPPIEKLYPVGDAFLGFGNDVALSTGGIQDNSLSNSPVSYWNDIVRASENLDVPPTSPMHIGQSPPPCPLPAFVANQIVNNSNLLAVLNDPPALYPLATSENFDLETPGISGPRDLGPSQVFPATTDDHLALTGAGPAHRTHLMVSPWTPLEPERTSATSGNTSPCHANISDISASNVHNYIPIRPKTKPHVEAEMGLTSHGFDATSAHSTVEAGPSASSAIIDSHYPSRNSTAVALKRTRRGLTNTLFAGCYKQRKIRPVKGVPENFCITLEAIQSTGNESSKGGQEKDGKRPSKVCLRCRVQHLKVSSAVSISVSRDVCSYILCTSVLGVFLVQTVSRSWVLSSPADHDPLYSGTNVSTQT